MSKPASKRWRRQTTAILLVSCLGALSCSKDHPPSLPLVGIYNRNTAKIEVTDIVTNDASQATRVRAVYERIATQVEVLAARRQLSEQRISATLDTPHVDRAQLDREVAQLRQDERAAFAEYIKYQMELRKLLSEKEFQKLGKFE